MWIEQYMNRGGVFIVPTFLLVEVAASISRRTGQSLQARETIRNLRAISSIHIVPLTPRLINKTIDIAADLQLRAGDAIYVAVAHQQNIPLVSWDKEQVGRAKSLITTYTPDNYPL
jgi:predicted nucleic acid-binding protein